MLKAFGWWNIIYPMQVTQQKFYLSPSCMGYFHSQPFIEVSQESILPEQQVF